MPRSYVANKAFSYGGRRLKPGDTFHATGPHGRVLTAIGKASASEVLPEAAPTVEVESVEDAEKPRRKYKRRDMTAEDAGE